MIFLVNLLNPQAVLSGLTHTVLRNVSLLYISGNFTHFQSSTKHQSRIQLLHFIPVLPALLLSHLFCFVQVSICSLAFLVQFVFLSQEFLFSVEFLFLYGCGSNFQGSFSNHSVTKTDHSQWQRKDFKLVDWMKDKSPVLD